MHTAEFSQGPGLPAFIYSGRSTRQIPVMAKPRNGPIGGPYKDLAVFIRHQIKDISLQAASNRTGGRVGKDSFSRLENGLRIKESQIDIVAESLKVHPNELRSRAGYPLVAGENGAVTAKPPRAREKKTSYKPGVSQIIVRTSSGEEIVVPVEEIPGDFTPEMMEDLRASVEMTLRILRRRREADGASGS